MKHRKIIYRNLSFCAELMDYGIFYRCHKIQDLLIKHDDFWKDVILWKNKTDLNLNIGSIIPAGVILGIKGDTLFPSIQFNKSFKFIQETNNFLLIAKKCRHKSIELHISLQSII